VTEDKEITVAKNRRAAFEFYFLETFVAGMVLSGTEIKSVRDHLVQLQDAYGVVQNEEVWIRNLSIEAYKRAAFFNHSARHDRKLLLNRNEIKKIVGKLKDKGITLIPVRMFISSGGYAKLEIALAKGKKTYDKRETIKEREVNRDLDRRKMR
jgi:SsrA-binding protein